MEQIVEQLLRSPKLELYWEQINSIRAEEQAERRRFLDRITEDDKAEFINGEVVIHSPVKLEHERCVLRLVRLAGLYVEHRGLGWVGGEHVMVSLTRNDYEPDVKFWPAEVANQFRADQMRFPAPTWIAEVLSSSTAANDRGVKFEDYAAHGVSEYWIIDPVGKSIEQYRLEQDHKYALVMKSTDGAISSSAIAGLVFPVEAIFDDAKNRAAIRALTG